MTALHQADGRQLFALATVDPAPGPRLPDTEGWAGGVTAH